MRKPVIRHFVAISIALVLIFPLSFIAADEAAEKPALDTLYIIPFLNVMIPSGLSSSLFDSFVDEMLVSGDAAGIKIRILKQDIDAVDKGWLAQQHFITGEVFDYAEDRGCCSTELEAKARIYRYRPGSAAPAGEILIPDEAFFEHDVSTPEAERVRLGRRMAKKLAGQLMQDLLPAR